MSGQQATAADGKAMTRAMWALGDYHRFARALVWEVGPVLVEACGIGPGQRVLDVAAGTGNVAIRAAERGADARRTSHRRTSGQGAARRPRAASSSTGSRGTPRRCRSPTTSSTS